jgi:hypothetical protein
MVRSRRDSTRMNSAISGPTASAISVSFQLSQNSHPRSPSTAIESFTTVVSTEVAAAVTPPTS